MGMREKAFYYYDSLSGRVEKFEETWKKYLQDEHQNKRKADLPDADMYFEHPPKYQPPQQNNGYDCGVFMCQFADCVARDVPFDFEQCMIEDIRLKMAVEIADEKLANS